MASSTGSSSAPDSSRPGVAKPAAAKLADSTLKREVEAWLVADPDPQTRTELEELLQAADTAGLQSRFSGSLKFGTAGLRGALGAGPNRMNQVVVRQTTAALVWVLQQSLGEALTIAVGYDGRRNSDIFAQDAAQVIAALGGTALLVQGLIPTPVLAHLTLAEQCQAGIMITASHNPPQDNGYKVYWSDGAQIISPHDVAVERARQRIGLLPADLAQLRGFEAAAPEGESSDASPGAVKQLSSEAAISQYVAAVAGELKRLFGAGLSQGQPASGRQQTQAQPAAQAEFPQCVYTPLHGVGLATLSQLFAELNLPAPAVVAAQAEPDGAFPTVAFPNPEEPGALDLALELAQATGAELVLANDPDADRLSVAWLVAEEPTGDRHARTPQLQVLSGNELGVLLGDGLLTLLGDQASDCLVGTTIVSSQLLAKVAAAHGAKFAETLTGFKWVARIGDSRPETMLFGYEEALGYSVLPEVVRDKDGISAAALFVWLMQRWRQAGTSPAERLRQLAAQHGLHLSRQLSFRYEGSSATSTMAAIMGSFRTSPPQSFGSAVVSQSQDYAEQFDRKVAPANVLVYHTQDGARVILRPSGTEPKLKVYLEVIVAPPQPGAATLSHSQLQQWQTRAQAQLDELAEEISQLISQRTPVSQPTS